MTTTYIYQYIINDQTTSDYSIVDTKTSEVVVLKENFNPIQHELLPQDSFIWDENEKVIVVNSIFKYMTNIPCILLCQERQVTKRCYLYKCIPYNKQFPFVWAVSTTHYTSDQYVVVQFKHWYQQMILVNLSLVLGCDHKSYWEYHLYCLQMNQSFDKIVQEMKRSKLPMKMEPYSYGIKSYPNSTAFTIGSLERAFDIQKMETGEIQLCIYVVNVGMLLDYFKLWMYLPTMYSTIQLPHRQQSMLSHFFETKCQLTKSRNNHVFRICITLDCHYSIKSILHENAFVFIHENYLEMDDDTNLLENEQYQLLLETTQIMCQKYKYLDTPIVTSHDVVAYITNFIQYQTAQEFLKTKKGILCNAVIQKQKQLKEMSLPDDIIQQLSCWLSDHSDLVTETQQLQMPAFAYLLSPFQRIVDVINIMSLQKERWKQMFSKEANEFYNRHVQNIVTIQSTMEKTKQIENESKLLHLYDENNEIFNELLYDGYVCKKTSNHHGYYYYIYFPFFEATMTFQTIDDLDEFSQHSFQITVEKDTNIINNQSKIQIELDINYSSLLDKYVLL